MISIRPKTPSQRRKRVVLVAALLLAAALAMTLEAGVADAAPETFTVTNTADSGEGSLRDAIDDANSNANPTDQDTIEFDIQSGCDATSGVCTISPTGELPTITEPVIIDGYTQTDASPNTLSTGNDAQLKVELSGEDVEDTGFSLPAITIRASNSVVRGLIINRWSGSGVQVDESVPAASGNTIEGNFIGTDASGTQDLGNNPNGVAIEDGASENLVGGTSASARNLISGNVRGVLVTLAGSGNAIRGNYIGTDASGQGDLGNDQEGVELRSSPESVVGGTSAAARNVISGNEDDGVGIGGILSIDNKIQGNYIGTDASGTQDLGNTRDGVEVEGAPDNVVGGTLAGARNVISGNDSDGVVLFSRSGNRVEGNHIGTDASGTQDLGNAENGVRIVFGTNSTVGGTSAAAANLISNNGFDGVLVEDPGATGNSILRNSIFDNDGLGIDLDGGTENASGVTANDPQDPDPGPNLLQNYPVITAATTPNGRSVSIQGTLNSNPNEAFTIQFFSSPTRDPSGFGEGKTYLGQTNVAANAGGNASFSFNANAPVLAGEFITATATNISTGDTSEFSRAVGVRDETSPRVASTNPTNRATGVPARANVFATFSEAMNPSTINPNTFKLFLQEEGGGQTQVPSAVSYNEEARRGRLDPNANLTPGATYVATVTERARDLAGNQLDQDPSTPGNQQKVWRFTVAR